MAFFVGVTHFPIVHTARGDYFHHHLIEYAASRYYCCCCCCCSSVNYNTKRISFSVSSRCWCRWPYAYGIQIVKHIHCIGKMCSISYRAYWVSSLIGSRCADNLRAICMWICLPSRIWSRLRQARFRFEPIKLIMKIQSAFSTVHCGHGSGCLRRSHFVSSLNKSTNHVLNL